MLSNLFSIFDPNTHLKMSLNWLSTMLPFILYPNNYWFKSSKFYMMFNMMIIYIYNELNKLMNKYNNINIFMFINIFFIILMMNFLGLFPYIFTPSSHLIITLPISLSLWLSIMMFFWYNKYNLSFAHLVPKGTPSMLMSFMVLIETISNLIRPGTLAIRLSANMIAGHLLFCLLGSTGSKLEFIMLILLILIQLMLFILESAVSIIQSYVFMTLSSLYSNEL